MKIDKGQLRKVLIQERRSLSQVEWRKKSQQICHHLRCSSLFRQAKTVLAYCSIRQEPDLEDLLFEAGKTWGLPRCVDQTLIWHEWTPQDRLLEPGAFGIAEPRSDSPIIEPEQVDLILVPCVACDRRGYRLGYGGGFYDRMFSQPEWKNKLSIGIVFEFAFIKELAIDPWDQPLTAVCTETRLYRL